MTAFPQHYTFHSGNWRLRHHSPAIGRLYAVHPNQEDRFYLRMLLCTLTGSDVRQIYQRAIDRVAPNRETCCVCLVSTAEVCFRPCSHEYVCARCVQHLQQQAHPQAFRCPMCRADVTEVIPLAAPTVRTDVHLLKDGSATFKAACRALDLLKDDAEWALALREAADSAMPEQLRSLFLHILCFCAPQEPVLLFDRFCQEMGDDHRKALEEMNLYSTNNVRTCTLYSLRCALDPNASAGERTALTNLPTLTDDEQAFIDQIGQVTTSPIAFATDYDQDLESWNFEDRYARCRDILLQKSLIDGVIELVQGSEQLLQYIDAPGGCGKTHCLNTLLSYFRGQGLRAIAVASTGIAALQLDGGRTVHLAFKLPYDSTGARRGPVKPDIMAESVLGRFLINNLDIIVWDEVPMTHRDIFDGIDALLRDFRGDNRPFGGLHVILAGDFRQTLPVVRNSSRGEQINASVLNSASFQQFDTFRMSVNLRVELCKRSDPERSARLDLWAQEILNIGEGRYLTDDDAKTEDYESVLPSIVAHRPVSCVADVTQMIHWSFGDLHQLSEKPIDEIMSDSSLQSVILCPRHTSVDYINDACLNMWSGVAQRKIGIDSYDNENDARVVTLEQLNARTPGGTPPQRLDLKVGMPLILLRNMNNDLMNGTRLLLVQILPHVIKCVVMTGRGVGREVFLPRFNFKHEGPDQPLTWTRRQFPVKPCWAMTINKSQGQTFSRVAVCLIHISDDGRHGVGVDKAEVFSHGQLYVALSRCGDPDEVCVYTTAERYNNRITLNAVWIDALPKYLQRQFDGSTSSQTEPSIQDDDTMYDARAHLNADDTFEVPYHGYVFGEHFDTAWDGNADMSDEERFLNCSECEVESWMNEATM